MRVANNNNNNSNSLKAEILIFFVTLLKESTDSNSQETLSTIPRVPELILIVSYQCILIYQVVYEDFDELAKE